MEAYEIQLSLATAIAVGLLIGLEREQSKSDTQGPRGLGGVRTYPIVALVGALATMLESESMWLPLIALGGVFALVVVSYAADLRRTTAMLARQAATSSPATPADEAVAAKPADADAGAADTTTAKPTTTGPDTGHHGATTEISVIGTYLLGALATSRGVVEPMADRLILVAGLGVVIAFLLSSKQRFHTIAHRVSRDDFYATTKFLIVAVIVLPLLPNRDLGPLGAINPRHLGLLVVTISGLSFLGYVAMRLWGAKRGMLFGAALGGLVSSTAVTLSFANRTKEHPSLAPVAAGSIAVAWTIMVGRVGVLVVLVDPSLLRTIATPLIAMMVASLVGLALTFRKSENVESEEIRLDNPFDLGSAIKVTLMFAVVLLVTKAATVYLGDQGLYLASALSGTTDVDAVTISSAKLSSTATVSALVATISISIAVAVNTIVKLGLAAGIGGKQLGRRVAIVAALVIVGGGAALAAVAMGG